MRAAVAGGNTIHTRLRLIDSKPVRRNQRICKDRERWWSNNVSLVKILTKKKVLQKQYHNQYQQMATY